MTSFLLLVHTLCRVKTYESEAPPVPLHAKEGLARAYSPWFSFFLSTREDMGKTRQAIDVMILHVLHTLAAVGPSHNETLLPTTSKSWPT